MNNKRIQLDSRVLGRRNFIQGASMAAASIGLPRALYARQGPTMVPPAGDAPPEDLASQVRHTLIYINLRGGADGLTMLAPANDTLYKQVRNITLNGAGANIGTQVDELDSSNERLGMTNWWLPAALAPLKAIYDDDHLAAIPAVGMTNFNQSHFVAMDLMELAVPPGGGIPPEGFMARALDTAQFATAAPLRGLVMSPRGTTSFLGAPKSLAIPDVTNFDFPAPTGGQPDQGMITAMKTMHSTASDTALKDASATAFGAINYLKGVYMNPPTVQGIGPAVGQYPDNNFGRQLRRAAQLILAGNPPEVIEIDIGGWDHHGEQEPNLPNGKMYGLMNTLARGLNAFHTDMSGNNYPYAPGDKWIDHVTCMTISEFGRQLQENNNRGTDHGKGGAMFVVGGSRLNFGVKDIHWTGGLAGMDDNGDVRVEVDYRNVFGEAFEKLFNMSSTDVMNNVFEGYSYTPTGLFI